MSAEADLGAGEATPLIYAWKRALVYARMRSIKRVQEQEDFAAFFVEQVHEGKRHHKVRLDWVFVDYVRQKTGARFNATDELTPQQIAQVSDYLCRHKDLDIHGRIAKMWQSEGDTHDDYGTKFLRETPLALKVEPEFLSDFKNDLQKFIELLNFAKVTDRLARFVLICRFVFDMNQKELGSIISTSEGRASQIISQILGTYGKNLLQILRSPNPKKERVPKIHKKRSKKARATFDPICGDSEDD